MTMNRQKLSPGTSPDLRANTGGIVTPNPFWLASAPPTNSGGQIMRAFDAGWGGAVWKTLGSPIQNVSSRFGGLHYKNTKAIGFNNIELITDRPLETTSARSTRSRSATRTTG
jgi:dihydropyrimidine dehydrogenase (NAD+) subunit PreA